MKCKQKNCENEASFMVYWASARVPSCEAHTNALRKMAEAMGLPGLQVNLIAGPGLEMPVTEN